MRVEMKVNWAGLAKPKAKKPQSKATTLEPPRSRPERRLWYIAVGREIEAGVASGRFSSLAEASRGCVVSGARITQLIDRPTRF